MTRRLTRTELQNSAEHSDDSDSNICSVFPQIYRKAKTGSGSWQQHHCERMLFVVAWNWYGFAFTVYLQQNTAYIRIAIITLVTGCYAAGAGMASCLVVPPCLEGGPCRAVAPFLAALPHLVEQVLICFKKFVRVHIHIDILDVPRRSGQGPSMLLEHA